MRTRNTILRGLPLTAALIMTCAGTLLAQMGQQGQQQNPPPTTPPAQGQQPTTPPAPQVNKEEEDAYKKFFESKGGSPEAMQTQITLGEDFLKKFPESRYKESVYARLTQDYLSIGKEKEMAVAAEKALELNPDNVDVLAVISMATARRIDPTALDAEQKLIKAETRAKHALAIIPTLPKPEGVTDEDFTKAKNDKMSFCHSGLGFVYYLRGKFAESAAEFAEATKLAVSADPVDYFVMGVADEQIKRFDDAATAYGKCAEAPGGMQDRCKKAQAEVKKRSASAPKP
jgi:tetratricopeptide (TPR) repeat protein